MMRIVHPLLERDGAAHARDLRAIRNRLAPALASGALQRPHPGVYVLSERARDPMVRVRAAQLSVPRGVLIGEAAVAVFEPGFEPTRLDVAVASDTTPRPGIRLHRLPVPDVTELDRLRLPPPAWNALWLAGYDEGAGIDHYQRRGGSPAELRDALAHFRGSHGVQVRRRVLAQTRAESWSLGERKLHQLLRRAGFTGWAANVAITTRTGVRMVVDVVFRRERVVLEFDGWEFHRSREAFEADRARTGDLVADGWVVLRFTWRQVTERPDWVERCIRSGLRRAAS